MHWLVLPFLLMLCLGVGAVGGRWTAPEIPTWYRALRKPAFNPPNWVFAPAWTTLYTLMAVAAWHFFLDNHAPGRALGLSLFALQLALNFAWSWIFFRRHALGAALAEILALWVAIVATIAVFAQADPLSAWLLAPYLAWVSFAAVLNAAIWKLNPAGNPPLARISASE